MNKFDTRVQELKYKVLTSVARYAWHGNLFEHMLDIPKEISPGKKSTMRCCIYKERAILAERVRMACSSKEHSHIIEVIDIACDDCPAGGYVVTDSCRGCLAHRCENVCPRNAITFDGNQKARIDKTLCVGCGKCAQVCPYSAIVDRKRPCENACKIKAISMDTTDGSAMIDYHKCTSCGACVYQCPFGAITDRSFILDAINLLKESEDNRRYRVYAIVAPSIASQFSYAKLGQVLAAIRKLGFYSVVEAALGADMVAYEECAELAEKGFLTSSCCPAFVQYIRTQFPMMAEHISHNLSPMATIAKYIKEKDPDARTIFIGPCTAKKAESQLPEVHPFVDCVLTFEELQALFDSRDLDLSVLPEEQVDTASFFGRIFARSGGLCDAVAQGLKERGLEFDYKPIRCDGIEACRAALMKASRGKLDGNFIEGMACTGGCIGGAGCLTHGDKNKADVDKYGTLASEKSISDALAQLEKF